MFFENEIGMVAVKRDIRVMVTCAIFVGDDASKVSVDVLVGDGSTYHTTLILITIYYILLIMKQPW